MNRKKWVVSECNKDLAAEIAENCGIEPFSSYLLVARGMADEFEVESFLFDTEISDPFTLPDMEKAVERIKTAISENEKITIFGDYDADGVTSTAILYSYLCENGANVDYYIPDRAGEGYGMSVTAIDKLKERGTELIITVDNGISAVEETKRAAELGIDIVVTDHHQAGDVLPEAVAVVDPHRKDSLTDFSDWAGVGVAFKLISALENGDVYDLIDKYGDILAVGTIADIVSLKGENRILVRAGLSVLNESLENGTLRKGLKALIDSAGVNNKNMTSMGAAFKIAPRINAAGRMGSANRALKLLLTEDEEEARVLAEEISQANSERQSIEKNITLSAEEIIENNPEIKFSRVIVVSGENWHQGVIGIVASRLTEKYGKPTVVISVTDGIAKGSARSIEGFSLYDAFYECRELLTQFGGHFLAAGMSLLPENIDAFRKMINDYAKKNDALLPKLKLDCKLNPSSVSVDILDTIEILEPFGAENPQPLFGLFNMKITSVQPVGNGKHLRISVTRAGITLPVMLFNTEPSEFQYAVNDTVDLAVRLSKNEYMGETKVSIQVKEMKMSGVDDEKIQKALALYEKFMGKEDISKDEKNLLLPSREFCGQIYKYIKASNGWCFNEEMLLIRLGLEEEKLSSLKIALDVLTELSVLICENGKYSLPIETVKVVLENSPIYKSLSD